MVLMWMALGYVALAASPAEKAEQPLCDAGDLDACFRLAAAYQFGHGDTPIDLDKARTLLDAGCTAKHPPSCNDLGAMYGDGISVPKDEKRAAELYVQACESMNAMSCGNLARFHVAGVAVPQDVARAEALFLKGCELGDGSSCNDVAGGYLGLRPGFPDKPKKGLELLTRACETYEDGSGCANLGYVHATGVGTSPDPERGFAYMQKACALGNAQACKMVGGTPGQAGSR